MKKNYIGLLLTLFFMGLVAFLIASILNYQGYMINIGLNNPSSRVIPYAVHTTVSLFFILIIWVIIKYNATKIPWTVMLLSISSFYIVWLPLTREQVLPLIQWIVPAGVSILVIVFASIHLISRLRFEREKKRLDQFIIAVGKNVKNSQNYRDAVEDDKKNINLIDGVEREENSKYFEINYSITEHDK